MDIDQRLELLHDLISCNFTLYFWSYDASLNLLHSNCPNEIIFNQILSLSGCKDYMLCYGMNNDVPLVLSNNLGLVWITAYEKKNGSLYRIHLIGPAFTTEVSFNNIEIALRSYQLSIALKCDMLRQLESLPVIPTTNYLQYALMLHLCVTNEKIHISDINYQPDTVEIIKDDRQIEITNEHPGVWLTEQKLFKMIEDGNLDYKSALDEAVKVSYGVKINIGDPIRQAKDSAIMFVTLSSRAAIRGGLSPSIAYSLCDYYTQSIESCSNISEISIVNKTMYDDFIHRVHKQKNNRSSISRPIQNCCDYIETHIHDKITIKDLAERIGYTEYYLSRKFKKEIGYSINDYIKNAKIEYAKMLLSSSTQSVQDISDSLNFCSRSYFADVFQKIVGTSPNEYRVMNFKV
jgi:AraC-like DNA-binding protein